MKTISHILFAASTLAFATFTAVSQDLSADLPSLMQQFQAEGSIVQRLPQAHGLDAFLVTKGDNRQTMYLSPDGNAVIAGMMFDREMRSVTRAQLEAVVPIVDTDTTSFDNLYARTTGFLVGYGDEPNIVIFADPLCEECRRFWRASAKAIREGHLTFYVVPVGVINTSSSPRTASALLGASDPAVAWLKFATTKNLPRGLVATTDLRSVVEQNNLAFFQYGFTKTPSFGFLTTEGDLNLSDGIPDGLYQRIADFDGSKSRKSP